jgi:EAL domain-containing protein (putative c-di-GMP-specific phosphodiesterase class I)
MRASGRSWFASPGRVVPVLVTGAALAMGYRVGREAARRPHGAAPSSPTGDASYDQIRQLVDDRAFRAAFQPVFSLRDGRLLMVEALTRFDRVAPAELATRSTLQWFRAAGQVGLGVELELAAVDVALQACADLPAHVPLSVNTSPDTLLDPRLEALLSANVDREVVVEVTEHAVVADYPGLATAIAGLRARGCRLAVDDAGAGFASLRHVVRLAPEIIKLDASLTQDIEHDPMRRALAASLVMFAHRTGSQLIVEGIERSEDLHVWHRLGADGAQGFLLGRPGPLQDWEDGPRLITARPVPIRSERRQRMR